jgi:EmrB/QacA subfamily drug resistance transporter
VEASKRGIVVAIMLAMVLAAVETTVVTIAVPTIVKDLNGFELVSWVFSLYLLTASVSTPIYGKLADLYGRKNTLSVGIIIFLIGSFACGLSQNMYHLMAFRAVQGLGAGAIYTITYTIVGDQFSLSERAKVQGWLSSIWGISSLIGPFIGGVIIDMLSWHWIFFVNIPFGIISILLIQKYVKESFEKKEVVLDYKGVISLSIGIIALLLTFMSNGKDYNIQYLRTGFCGIIAIVSLAIFYKVEKKAKEPVMPFEIFDRSNILINAISFIFSAVLMGIDVYMAIYIQNVLEYNATVSGLIMAPMSITWFLAAFFIGDKIVKYGEKSIIVFSGIPITIGTLFIFMLGVNSSIFSVVLFSAILGIGFGLNFTTLTIVIQMSVDYNKRGAATASNTLLRNLGQTIGISVFGSIFNFSILRYLRSLNIFNISPNAMYSGNIIDGISKSVVKESLNFSLHIVFFIMIILDVFAIVLSIMIPNMVKNDK